LDSLITFKKPVKAGELPAVNAKSRSDWIIELFSDHSSDNSLIPLLLTLLMVSLVTALLFALDQGVAVDLVTLAYLVPIIVAATRWGVWPAILASIASMMAADYLFFPPIFSFEVEDPQEIIDLALFVAVAIVSSNLASRLRRETAALRLREQEIQQLYEFSRLLAACFTVSDLITAIEKYLSRALGQQAVFHAALADGQFDPPASSSVPTVVADRIAAMMACVGLPSYTLVDGPTQEVWLLTSVRSETTVHGLVAVNIGSGSADTIERRTIRVKTILEEVSLTFQRLDIGRAMQDARLHLQAQLLRDAFHGTLSHELNTPLAAIRGAASVLDAIPTVRGDARTRLLVEAISEEAAHLDGFIHNLLNATRVTAGGVTPRLEWADPRDIVNAAVAGRARKLAAHKVEIAFAEDLPLVHVDSGLIEEACGQLLENAAKYSSSGSPISIDTRADLDRVIVAITDRGVGMSPDEQRQLGHRSFRSPRHQATVPGNGLGFWIASTFIRANGGTIGISSRGHGQGTTASIALPGSQMDPLELMDLADE